MSTVATSQTGGEIESRCPKCQEKNTVDAFQYQAQCFNCGNVYIRENAHATIEPLLKYAESRIHHDDEPGIVERYRGYDQLRMPIIFGVWRVAILRALIYPWNFGIDKLAVVIRWAAKLRLARAQRRAHIPTTAKCQACGNVEPRRLNYDMKERKVRCTCLLCGFECAEPTVQKFR